MIASRSGSVAKISKIPMLRLNLGLLFFARGSWQWFQPSQRPDFNFESWILTANSSVFRIRVIFFGFFGADSELLEVSILFVDLL